MPIIPGRDEGQVLNAGSPVPIAAPEEARGMGTQTAAFGNAMFQLGDALDKVMTSAKNRQNQLDANAILQSGRQTVLKRKMESEAAGPIEGDNTGYGQVESFVKNSQSDIDELLAKVNIQDPTLKKMVNNSLMDLINDTSKEVGAHEVKKRLDNNKVKEAKLISSWTSLVGANPSKIEEAWAEGETLIITNPDIPDSVKNIRVNEFKKQSIEAGVRGLIQRGVLKDDPNSFAQGEIFLEKYAPGLFSTDEKQKLSDEINTTQNKHYTTQLQKLTRDEKRQAKYAEAVEKNLLGYFSSSLALAGNNDLKRRPIEADIEKSILSGKISEQKGRALLTTKVFKEEMDDFYETKIMTSVFKTDEYAKAVDQVNQDLSVGRVSTDRANAIINKLKNLEERKRNDPTYSKIVSDGERLIRDMAAPSLLEPLSQAMRSDKLAKVNMAVQDYHKIIAANPKADPTALSRRIIEENFGHRTKYIKGAENFLGLTTVQGVEKQRSQLLKEGIILQKQGLMTPQKKKKLQENLNTLKELEIRLKTKEEVKAQTSQQGTGTGAVPARGK